MNISFRNLPPVIVASVLSLTGIAWITTPTATQLTSKHQVATPARVAVNPGVIPNSPVNGNGSTTGVTDDRATVAALHREWILVGWEHKASDRPFSFRRKLGRYYDWSANDVLLYDDFDPQHRIVRSAAEYGAIWDPSFAALRTAHHRVTMEPVVLVSNDLATSTLQFTARLERKDGKVTGIRTLSSLVWRKIGTDWKIVREHNSTVVVPTDQIDALMNQPTQR